MLEHAAQLLDLPLTEVEVGGGSLDPLVGVSDDSGSGGVGEAVQLGQMVFHPDRVFRALPGSADQEGALDRGLDVDQLSDSGTTLFRVETNNRV